MLCNINIYNLICFERKNDMNDDTIVIILYNYIYINFKFFDAFLYRY